MADEAFALSPISARAALPGEEDYAAISEAFMETSRGRWFLTEYAKRNRNADTRMVLDAVARIEQSLAAQKEETQAAQRDSLAAQRYSLAAQRDNLAAQRDSLVAQQETLAAQQQAAEAAAAKSAAAAVAAAVEAAEHRLKAALAAVRTAVEAAQASATETIDGLGLEQRQAAVRKGSRVLREIAWRLREIGNDSRICDLIDAQVAVIERASEEVAADEAKAALGAAFAAIGSRLTAFTRDGHAGAPAEAAAPGPAGLPPMAATAEASTVQETAVQETAEAPETAFIEPAEITAIEPAPAEASLAEALLAETAPLDMEGAPAPGETFEATDAVSDATADADDEAILDIIAMEMGAPDPIDDEEIAAAAAEQAHFAEPAPVEPAVMEVPEPAAVAEPPFEMPAPPAVEAVAAPAAEMSLGSSILASGMFSKAAKPANDPLAPIRRMSQVEKIAFFS